MKKSLFAFSLLAAVATPGHAQSSVSLYGSLDINYMKTSWDSSVTMTGGAGRSEIWGGINDNSYIGFKGVEDLGGGLKAVFQLEKRFNLANGKSSEWGDFDGAANVGVAGSFGQIRFGRVNELSTETYRRLDPFDQNGVGAALQTTLRGSDFTGRLSYTARYDSMDISGFHFGASYTLKNGPYAIWEDSPGITHNAGYAISGTYANGPLYLVANYNKAVNSSDSYNWNLGGSYAFGPLKLSLGYESTKINWFPITEKNWLLGATYRCGNGTIKASFNRFSFLGLDNGQTDEAKRYALGYTYDLGRRTALYANYAHTRGTAAGDGWGPNNYSYYQAEVGMTHKF